MFDLGLAQITNRRCRQTRGLVALVLLALAHPPICEACSVYELTGEGFAANVLWLLHAFPLFGPPTNGTFYLDQTRWPHKCNETGGWEDFFAGGHLVNWSPEAQKAEKEECVRLKAKDVEEMMGKLNTGTEELDGMAVNRLWRFQPGVQRAVNASLRELKGLNNPTVAFHIRGGDLSADLQNNKRQPVTPRGYVERALEAFGNKAKGGTCVILGDDYKLMGETAKVAKQKLGCQVFRRPSYFRKAGHLQEDYNKEPLAKRCSYTVQYLQEIEMMTHSDYFVGTFHSNLPKIVQTLRYALLHKDKRTFADASEAKADWYEKVREYFREDAKSRGGKKKGSQASALRRRALLEAAPAEM